MSQTSEFEQKPEKLDVTTHSVPHFDFSYDYLIVTHLNVDQHMLFLDLIALVELLIQNLQRNMLSLLVEKLALLY